MSGRATGFVCTGAGDGPRSFELRFTGADELLRAIARQGHVRVEVRATLSGTFELAAIC
jgi:hypothetical protein